MAFKKLTILVEKNAPSASPTFSTETDSSSIVAMYNPETLSISQALQTEQREQKESEKPEVKYVSGKATEFSVKLLFDTYSPQGPAPAAHYLKSVKEYYVDKVLKLLKVESNAHRPPLCKVVWGSFSREALFQGILFSCEQTYQLFLPDGTPVRAELDCKFIEVVDAADSASSTRLNSADVAKLYQIRRGDTLSSIASREYQDPSLWRLIAEENGIDDPLRLKPGTLIALPSLQPRPTYRR